ncbi:MAG: hypothetical protein LN417_09525 [Candidatus Thermoplasmatota archaeon]|nr:hypothetical protein [Candidatus Thermoplasmatota archaeon]
MTILDETKPEAHLVAFCDGSYKKVYPIKWKHSQWIHYTLDDGSVVMINPINVNYIHRGIDPAKYEDPDKHKAGI